MPTGNPTRGNENIGLTDCRQLGMPADTGADVLATIQRRKDKRDRKVFQKRRKDFLNKTNEERGALKANAKCTKI